MRDLRWLAWAMLAIWASWLSAAQAVAVSRTLLGAWTPDLGLLLVIALAGALRRSDVMVAALIVGLARVAHSIEPPAALLAGFLGVALAVQSVRRFAELEQPLVRLGLCAAAALIFGLWLNLVHAVRTGMEVGLGGLGAALPQVLPGVLSTTFCGLVLATSLSRLPGLTPLRRQRW
ncbi:MAG: hypothetical protein V3T22_05020 [Planctomycetota bacterium]